MMTARDDWRNRAGRLVFSAALVLGGSLWGALAAWHPGLAARGVGLALAFGFAAILLRRGR